VPTLDPDQQRARLAAAPVARLATLRADGTPRLVPVTFALVDGQVCHAVDDVKAKRSARLARLDDIARDPRVAMLADEYDPDWTRLWWVRVDGTAEILDTGDRHAAALAALRAKYPQYTDAGLGAVVAVTPERWAGWAAG
jgi:PPOX class probable F420-dependent enzyme